MNSGEERRAVFGVSCRDPAPSFEHQERVFDQMAQLIQLLVVRSLLFSVLLRWDYRPHTLGVGLVEDRVGIIAFIRDQMRGIDAFDQATSLCAICSGTFRNKHSDRHTKRIHGQMYLGVEPPLVRLMSWLPPFAPAACGCTLQ